MYYYDNHKGECVETSLYPTGCPIGSINIFATKADCVTKCHACLFMRLFVFYSHYNLNQFLFQCHIRLMKMEFINIHHILEHLTMNVDFLNFECNIILNSVFFPDAPLALPPGYNGLCKIAIITFCLISLPQGTNHAIVNTKRRRKRSLASTGYSLSYDER